MSFLVSGCQFSVKLLIVSPQRIPGAGTKGKGKREKKLERGGKWDRGLPGGKSVKIIHLLQYGKNCFMVRSSLTGEKGS